MATLTWTEELDWDWTYDDHLAMTNLERAEEDDQIHRARHQYGIIYFSGSLEDALTWRTINADPTGN